MVDQLTDAILERFREEAIELGSDLIQDGADLLEKHLEGQASDEEILAWLRRKHEREGDES